MVVPFINRFNDDDGILNCKDSYLRHHRKRIHTTKAVPVNIDILLYELHLIAFGSRYQQV